MTDRMKKVDEAFFIIPRTNCVSQDDTFLMAGKKSSIDIINKRRMVITEIKQDYMDKGQKLTTNLLITELDGRGFKSLSRATVERDLIEVAKGNNYVRNIAEATYSQTIEDMFESFNITEEWLWKCLDNPPKITRQRIRAEPTSKTGYRVMESIVETISPLSIVRAIREIVEAKKSLLSGNVLNLSVALLGEKYRIMEQKVKEAENLKIVQEETSSQHAEEIKNLKIAVEEYRLKEQQVEEIKRHKMLFGNKTVKVKIKELPSDNMSY